MNTKARLLFCLLVVFASALGQTIQATSLATEGKELLLQKGTLHIACNLTEQDSQNTCLSLKQEVEKQWNKDAPKSLANRGWVISFNPGIEDRQQMVVQTSAKGRFHGIMTDYIATMPALVNLKEHFDFGAVFAAMDGFQKQLALTDQMFLPTSMPQSFSK